ncbi:MAG: DHH family phosphoesterase [Planctomycetaceae bacterium]
MRLDWASLLDLLRTSADYVLTSHLRPDCDALGSELGLCGVLEAIGKRVRIVNAQPTPPGLSFLDPGGRIQSLEGGVTPDEVESCGVLLVLDTSAFAQLWAMGEIARRIRSKVLVVDHHVSEDDLSDRWFKDTAAEATGRIVAEIALRLGVSLERTIAQPLFCALATDTGWFRFPSATGETFRLASRLVDAGASPPDFYRDLFEQDTLPRLNLVGRVLAGATTRHDGRVITSRVRRSDFAATGARGSDTEDIVNLTLTVKGTQLAAILIELPDGKVKVSFRSRSHVDASLLAARFGGGGHRAAAGATLDGPFEESQRRVDEAVDEAWSRAAY